jgi:hypothetical protein
MDLVYVGIAVLFFLSAYGLMRICEFPEERKPGGDHQ